MQIRPPIAPPLAPAPAPQPDGSTPPPAPAAPAQAPTPSATLSQLPLPPQLALQLQRHEQQPEQRKYSPKNDNDCDSYDPGRHYDEYCELQWGDSAHWVRRPDGSRVWVTPPIPLVPIGPNPGKPPSPGNSNDGMPGGRFEDLDPVVVEDSRDPPPSYPSSPLPFDAFPPDHGGGVGGDGGGGPAPEGPAPASPAQPAPIETAPPAPPAGSPPPPFAGRVISEDSGGGPIQRDNRDHSQPDSFIPEHLRDIHRQVVRELIAEQAREDSLPDSGDFIPTGGGAPRAPRGMRAVSPVVNQSWDAALNLAADPIGLLGELPALYNDLARMRQINDRANAERQIDYMRQRMREAGMTNVSNEYQMAWVNGGNLVRDYQATAQRLQSDYNAFLQDRRLRATWGENYRDIRIGNQNMTVQEFERHMINLQYQAVNDAYQEALELESQGNLRRPHEISLNMAIGRHIDQSVRQTLRNALSRLGINESQSSQIAAINRYLTSPDSDRYGIPDARLGENFYLDSTLAFKNPNTRQIRQWHSIREGHYMIIRPDALGGSYAIPGRYINKFPLSPK